MFLSSINWFRGIAIIFVVMGHVHLTTFAGMEYNYDFMSNGTFFFVLIAGFLFHYLKEKFQYTDYIRKKFKFVVLPYLFVLIPGVLLAIYYYVNGLTWFKADEIPEVQNLVYYVFYLITHGGTVIGPLWFIPMICIFFVVSPVIKMIMESRYFGLITTVFFLFTLTSDRPELPELSFIYWLGVYLLGGYLSANYSVIQTHSKKILVVSTLALIVWSFIETSLVSHSDILKLIKTFVFMSLFCIIEDKNIELKVFDVLAKYSFGIFFLHGYILQAFQRAVVPIAGANFLVWAATVISCIVIPILIVKLWSTHLSARKRIFSTRYFFGV
ncbi:acyltransferase family protein [Oceanisphaera avium]|uniref:Acyltransferase 3 domain-containing protein n=1 Tax=Oceanisphaera avium TaxID=1903694 RepID=A0A1Y0CYJ6_9GAMM|nr:acyltransferase [Oceanisphaera avium]ART80401.1 hypothetical protein CBP12_09815 [Oceanisphaera avium]